MCMQRHPHARKDTLMHAKSPSHAQRHTCTCINLHAHNQARHCVTHLHTLKHACAHIKTLTCANKHTQASMNTTTQL